MEGTKGPHGGSDCNVTIREQPVATPEWQTRITVEDDMKPRVQKGRLLLAGGMAAMFTFGMLAAGSTVLAASPATVGLGTAGSFGVLAGTTVTFTDSAGASSAAPLYFVSPGQVNAVVPAGLKPGPATFQVAGATGFVTLSPVAPALFTANANG